MAKANSKEVVAARRAAPPHPHVGKATPPSAVRNGKVPGAGPVPATLVAAPPSPQPAPPPLRPPEWQVVPRRQGHPNREVDYPEAMIRKLGRECVLNEHAVRLLCSLGGDVRPPEEFHVEVLVDREQRLLGFRVVPKGSETFACRRLKQHTPSWRVGVSKAIESSGVPITKRVRLRVVPYGAKVYGFHFGPEGGKP